MRQMLTVGLVSGLNYTSFLLGYDLRTLRDLDISIASYFLIELAISVIFMHNGFFW